MHTAFITGCGTGFGHLLARTLLEAGHRVVATDPNLEALAPLGDDPKLLKLALDVTDPAQLRRAAQRAQDFGPCDVLVNNAGYAVFGSQEEADLGAVREMFDVNVFGLAAVTQQMLPQLRSTGGTVVQLSSVAGRTVFPESGFYAASKYAVEAMTEALYQECCTFGVRVRLIQPGSFDTQFLARAIQHSTPRADDSPYQALHALWDDRKFAVLEKPQNPTLVVDAIIASLAAPQAFLRIPVGPDSERILALRDALGADGWSTFSGARNGGPALHSPVMAPAEVCAADASDPRWLATEKAYRLGHLDHWKDDSKGAQALQILAGR